MGIPIPNDYDTFSLPTERLLLRYPHEKDCAPWVQARTRNYHYLTCWEPSWPMDHLTYNGFYGLYEFSRKEHQEGNSLNVFIFHQETEKLIGGAEVVAITPWPLMKAMVGYWIDEQHRGKGYMPEALKALIIWLQQALKLIRFEAACLLSNRPSHQVLRKIGFKEEGIIRDFAEINGQMQDHLLFGLVARDFNSL
jgi:[ribosomal protein S5]-alanine N-acetyltransferase